jgi:hypothetical protein
MTIIVDSRKSIGKGHIGKEAANVSLIIYAFQGYAIIVAGIN